jgi:hypothetical protein
MDRPVCQIQQRQEDGYLHKEPPVPQRKTCGQSSPMLNLSAQFKMLASFEPETRICFRNALSAPVTSHRTTCRVDPLGFGAANHAD